MLATLKVYSLKILVVDDDITNRMLLHAFLIRIGHTVVEAENGEQALDVFLREKPDLVMMDVSMPVMSGYEAAQRIKALSGKKFVPIIFLTALTDEESLARCVESGGDDFLSKPFSSILIGAKVAAMQRILAMQRELEKFRSRTEEEVELAQHVFEAATQRARSTVLPNLETWSVAAGHFSGDLTLYDHTDNNNLYLLLCDFMGHGFSAAIGALPTADIFFAMTRRSFSLPIIAAEINRKLGEVLPPGHFCAMAFCCIDLKHGRIEILNAGLPAILLLDQAGQVLQTAKSSFLPLGVVQGDAFDPQLVQLEYSSGQTLLLHSDGVTDARNAAGEMFGEARLLAALGNGSSPFVAIKHALTGFIGDHPPDDDISLIALRL